MTLEVLLAAAAIVVAALIYWAGIQRGVGQERARKEHAEELERQRQQHDQDLERVRQRHERQLEQERREQEMVSRAANEYVTMVRNHKDEGPHALATLGLQQLGSDRLIREAIDAMRVRTGRDPWAGHGSHVVDLDLVLFFSQVSTGQVNFFNVSVESVANQLRANAQKPPSSEEDLGK